MTFRLRLNLYKTTYVINPAEIYAQSYHNHASPLTDLTVIAVIYSAVISSVSGSDAQTTGSCPGVSRKITELFWCLHLFCKYKQYCVYICAIYSCFKLQFHSVLGACSPCLFLVLSVLFVFLFVLPFSLCFVLYFFCHHFIKCCLFILFLCFCSVFFVVSSVVCFYPSFLFLFSHFVLSSLSFFHVVFWFY